MEGIEEIGVFFRRSENYSLGFFRRSWSYRGDVVVIRGVVYGMESWGERFWFLVFVRVSFSGYGYRARIGKGFEGKGV